MFKNINNPMFNKAIKNEPKFTGYRKSDEENKSNWEYDVKLLMAGNDLQKERQMDWKRVKASTIEEKKIKRNQKIKVKLFCQEENINKKI